MLLVLSNFSKTANIIEKKLQAVYV